MIIKIVYSCFLGLLLIKAGCVAPNNKAMSEDIVLTIYHYKIPCAGEHTQLCYLLKINEGDLQYYHGQIKGFDYEWGYNYSISVEKIHINNPRSDAASFEYELKKIIKKEKILPDETFELPLQAADQSLIEIKNGTCYYFGEQKIQTGRYSCSDLKKAQQAVFSHDAGDKPGLVLIKIK